MIQKQHIIIITSILSLGFIALIVYSLIPKSYVIIETAPEKVLVLINKKDKKTLTNGDKLTLSPGKYSFTFYRNEFDPTTVNIELKNGETKEIVTVLTPLTEAAKKLLANEKSDKIIEKYTGIRMVEDSTILEKRYPILKSLPIENRNYVITGCKSNKYPGDSTRIALCVDIPSEDFKEIVYNDIKALNYNPENYEFIWNNYLDGV